MDNIRRTPTYTLARRSVCSMCDACDDDDFEIRQIYEHM